MRGVLQEKAKKSPVKGHNYEFLPPFFQTLGYLEYFNPLNGMRFWKFYINRKSDISFLKKDTVVLVVSTRSKGLK